MNSSDETTEMKELRKEVKFLKTKLRVRVDLALGDVTLLSIEEKLPQHIVADIEMLTKLPQWRSFRYWYVLNAKMLYEQSAGTGKDEAYIMARLAKCLIDMIQSAEAIKPDAPVQGRNDSFDLQDQDAMMHGHGELPLAPVDDI